MEASLQAETERFISRLMRYLSRVQDTMEQAPMVWVAIDCVQFLTITVCLLGQVIQAQYHTQGSAIINNFLNIFFNYNSIYDWLVISGAAFACIIIVGLIVYLFIEHKNISNKTKKRFLKYCALTATLAIGLCELFFQIMANNLTNTISGILDKTLNMSASLILFFLLNLTMMVFVSIFNSQRRIFRFCLAFVSLALNLIPFTVTCILLVALSLYYQQMDKLVYKKLFYFIIMLTCVWCALEINDRQNGYFLGSRFIYFGAASLAILVYFIHFENNVMNDSSIVQNTYLIELYKKKLKKQDKKEDYLLADQYFTMHYEKQTDTKSFNQDHTHNHLITSVQKWEVAKMKEKLIEKIKWDKRNSAKTLSAKSDICYFQFLIELKVNMVSLLREVFQLMYEKKNDNIQVTYQINKLILKIKKQFEHQTPSTQDQALKVEAITNLQHLYQKFYTRYATIVEHLQDIFDSIQKHNGHILETTESKLANFTSQQKLLKKILKQIQSVAPNKLQTKLYKILSQLWDNYQNNSQTSSLKLLQNHTNLPESAQKFSFSYVVISNQTIKYASVKFLSTFSYKQSYIIGENISMIFPSKFSQFIVELLQKNAEKKIFHSQVPILNQKGIFEIVNSTFYLLPEFKGEITYIILFKNNLQLETKSLFLFNSGTLCIEGFNRKIINRFKFSLQKINLGLQKGAIQFSNLFIFNNQDIDIFTSPPKLTGEKSKMSRRSTQKKTHVSIKQRQNEKSLAMKAMLKVDYLSDIKRAAAKNVNLETQISFQINNISYKVIKVEDATHEKFVQSSTKQDKTWEIKILKDQSGKNGSLEKSTKDLKKRYENQKFFCPIPNPYLPRILQKLNSFQERGRFSNFMLIRIFFAANLIFFMGGLTGVFIESSNFKTSIVEFENQAKSLNRQYSYFMQGIVHAYSIHHMAAFPSQFIQYIQTHYDMNQTEATTFYKNHVDYLYANKKSIIQKYQDAYFDVPIVYNSPTVDVSIFTDWFLLTGSSKTTLYYDIVVFMLDSQSPIILNVITQNFQLYTTLIEILRPDGRYDSQINALQQVPSLIMLVLAAIMAVICLFIYFWIYQLRDTRQEIKSIYQLIKKKQIDNAKNKLIEIQDMIQVLTNNKKSTSQQISQTESRPTTVSEINSVHNLGSEKKKQKGSIRSFEGQGQETENESAKLLNTSQQQNVDNKTQVKWKINTSSKGFSLVIETLLRYPLYFILLIINLGALVYIYFSMNERNASYIQAFQYFEKIRGQNFEFRYLYAKSQEYAFFKSVKNSTYVDINPFNLSYKNTQFSYQRPDGFAFTIDENLCSLTNLANITDPWFANYNCTQVDGHILTQQFSQANEQYERNLRQITNATYSQLITDPNLTDTYFNAMYEYQVFKNYFNQLSEMNFQQNVDHMGAQYQQDISYLFYAVIVWVIVVMLFGFIIIFPKLQAEILTIISLIKLIPSQTLLNMKAASLIKKRNLLEKLSRL